MCFYVFRYCFIFLSLSLLLRNNVRDKQLSNKENGQKKSLSVFDFQFSNVSTTQQLYKGTDEV